jgi:glycopeptide antibiotics resistance protein
MKPRPFRAASLFAFLVYLAAVLWVTVFSRQPVLEMRWNYIPVFTLAYGDFYCAILPNVLLFIPIGIFLYGALPQGKLWRPILAGIGISLCIELVQLFVHVGICDIDDFLANSLGCGLGVLAAWLLTRLLNK